jgi:hypothetical protein
MKKLLYRILISFKIQNNTTNLANSTKVIKNIFWISMEIHIQYLLI